MAAEADKMGSYSKIKNLRTLKDCKTASVLLKLFDKDCAGAWAPKANHKLWPMPLHLYKDIYLELVPMLPANKPLLDDNVNNERWNRYCSLMQKFLKKQINIAHVKQIIAAIEAKNEMFFLKTLITCFMLVLRCVATPMGNIPYHNIDSRSEKFLRWATIPVVKVAQAEKVVNFPSELNAPWSFLQQNFGVTSEDGNITANVLYNINEKNEKNYKINVGISDLIRSLEKSFFCMFYNLKILVFINTKKTLTCF